MKGFLADFWYALLEYLLVGLMVAGVCTIIYALYLLNAFGMRMG